MSEFKKYSSYKDSGVEWLGMVPEHWETKRMKFLFNDVSVKNRPEAELLSVTQTQGVVPRTWVENRMVMPSGNLESFKFISKGDFAISLRSFEGGLEYCYHDGIISPAYTVLKKTTQIVDNYYKFLFKSNSFISEMQTSVVGIREGKNISYSELSYSLIPIPPLSEQTAIANYLDQKTTQIDRAIELKEQTIALLKERKQIVIQELVTGKWKIINGELEIRDKAELKDSGVEWIGEVPVDWEMTPIKRLKANVKNAFVDGPFGSNLKSVHFVENGDVYVIESGTITRGYFISYDFKTITERHFNTISRSECKKGDIIIAKIGAYYGMCAELPELDKRSVISGNSLKITLNNEVMINSYFVLTLNTVRSNNGYIDIVNISAQPALSLGGLNNLKIPHPNLTEQQTIVHHIEQESTKIDRAISLQEQEIEKLKELKATLIDGAVRGKIKV